MDIRKIDKNFLQNAAVPEGTVFYGVTEPPFSLYGVFYEEKDRRFLRMPQKIADEVNSGVGVLCRNTSGGRVRFSTDSAHLTLAAKYGVLNKMTHMPLSGSGGFALCENTEKGEIFLCSLFPDFSEETGFVRTVPLAGKGMRNYTIYFPLYNDVNDLALGFAAGARVGKGAPYRPIKPVVYYGSSITQGGCASRADTDYQGFICKRNNVDFINLGFSGNAKGEERMADYLATLDCSALVIDYDHNAPSAAFLRETHCKFYERYRKQRPDTPVVFVSKPNYYRDPDAPERLKIIRETYKKALAAGDKVYFVHGKSLFGKEWMNCEVDGCHPTDYGFYRMSLAIGRALDRILR